MRLIKGLAAALLVSLLAAGFASARKRVPDRVYSGVAADGATVRFDLAAGGGFVRSYRFSHVIGRQTTGGKCTFVGHGASGVWRGAAVRRGAFAYRLGDALTFRGRLRGARAIRGAFAFYAPAAGQSPACATGTVRFIARRVHAS